MLEGTRTLQEARSYLLLHTEMSVVTRKLLGGAQCQVQLPSTRFPETGYHTFSPRESHLSGCQRMYHALLSSTSGTWLSIHSGFMLTKILLTSKIQPLAIGSRQLGMCRTGLPDADLRSVGKHDTLFPALYSKATATLSSQQCRPDQKRYLT